MKRPPNILNKDTDAEPITCAVSVLGSAAERNCPKNVNMPMTTIYLFFARDAKRVR